MQAATVNACSIHKTGPFSSTADKASFMMVFEAARHVRRVNANAEFVNDRPRNFL